MRIILLLVMSFLILVGCSSGEFAPIKDIKYENINNQSVHSKTIKKDSLNSKFTRFKQLLYVTLKEKLFDTYQLNQFTYNSKSLKDEIRIIKITDQQIYFIRRSISEINGIIYELYSLDFDGHVKKEGDIASVTGQIFLQQGFNQKDFIIKEYVKENVIYLQYIYDDVPDEKNKKTMVKIEKVNVDDAIRLKNINTKEIFTTELTSYNDTNVIDIGRIIDTTECPVYVLPVDEGKYQVNNLCNRKYLDVILTDQYNFIDEAENIIYIDFKNDNYFVENKYENELKIKRISITTGEPYTYSYGTKVKEATISAYGDEDFNSIIYGADENSFFLVTSQQVYLINNELEIIDSVQYHSKYNPILEGGIYYIGDNKFTIFEIYENKGDFVIYFLVSELK